MATGWLPVAGVAVELCCAKIGAAAKVSARLMMLRPRDGNLAANLVDGIAEFTGPDWVGVGTSCRQRERNMTGAGKWRKITGLSIRIG
jgi:hypothetical protein